MLQTILRVLFFSWYTPLKLTLNTADGYLRLQATADWECFRTRAKENIRLFNSVSNWRMKKLMQYLLFATLTVFG
jgi:hypothetical protein